MTHARGPDTVRVIEFKGLETDTAADLGRRHQTEDVAVRRALLNAGDCIGSWLQFPESLSIVMDGVGRLPIPLFGVKGVGKSNARLTSGLMLIMPRCQARLVFWMGPGFRFMVGAFLVRTWLPGLKVLTCSVKFMLSWLLGIGPLRGGDMGHFSLFEQ